jgi:hypothetical protein
VRDHLADALTTLPGLLGDANDASLHFYFANLPAMHKNLFPRLTQAYEAWVVQGERSLIGELVSPSKAHWCDLAMQMLDVYRNHPDDYAGRLQTLIENNKF